MQLQGVKRKKKELFLARQGVSGGFASNFADCLFLKFSDLRDLLQVMGEEWLTW